MDVSQVLEGRSIENLRPAAPNVPCRRTSRPGLPTLRILLQPPSWYSFAPLAANPLVSAIGQGHSNPSGVMRGRSCGDTQPWPRGSPEPRNPSPVGVDRCSTTSAPRDRPWGAHGSSLLMRIVSICLNHGNRWKFEPNERFTNAIGYSRPVDTSRQIPGGAAHNDDGVIDLNTA